MTAGRINQVYLQQRSKGHISKQLILAVRQCWSIVSTHDYTRPVVSKTNMQINMKEQCGKLNREKQIAMSARAALCTPSNLLREQHASAQCFIQRSHCSLQLHNMHLKHTFTRKHSSAMMHGSCNSLIRMQPVNNSKADSPQANTHAPLSIVNHS